MFTVSARIAWSTLCSAETARIRRWTSRGPMGRSVTVSRRRTFAKSKASKFPPVRSRSAAMSAALIENARGMVAPSCGGPRSDPQGAHEREEILHGLEAQHHVGALLLADGGP